MGDIFVSKEARSLLAHKHIAVIGGSNMRGLYKDIIWLINDNSFIPKEVLGEKLEQRFPTFKTKRCTRVVMSKRVKNKFPEDNTDCLLWHEHLHPGRTYIEPRFYCNERKDITLNFKFVTRAWSPQLDKWLEDYETHQEAKLDLIIMNSVLWDVNRWGPFGIRAYKENITKLLTRVKSVLSDNGLFIWLTAQPGSKELNSGAMESAGLEFQKKTTRYNVVEANFYAAHKVAEFGFDVIDLHYYFLLQTFRRNRDGIHWTPEANRYVTNMILTHVALSEGKPLPGRNKGDFALERVIFMADVAKGTLTNDNDVKAKIQELERISAQMVQPPKRGMKQLPSVDVLRGNANNNELVNENLLLRPIEQQQNNQMNNMMVMQDPGPYRNAGYGYRNHPYHMYRPIRPPMNRGLQNIRPVPARIIRPVPARGPDVVFDYNHMPRMRGPFPWINGPQMFPQQMYMQQMPMMQPMNPMMFRAPDFFPNGGPQFNGNGNDQIRQYYEFFDGMN